MVVKTLIETKVWKDVPTWLLPTVLITIGISAFWDNVRAAWVKAKAPERAARRSEAQMAIIGALAQIADRKKISFLDLGASVFMIRQGRRWVPRWWRDQWRWAQPHLERRMRVRVADTPQASNVRWTKGKGTIGACWAKDKSVHRDRLPVAERHGATDFTPEKFDHLRDEVRSGMTLEEFQSIAGKYAEIHAVPIKDPDGRIVGVLSVDLAAKNRKRADGTALDGPDVEELITAAAKLVQKSRVIA